MMLMMMMNNYALLWTSNGRIDLISGQTQVVKKWPVGPGTHTCHNQTYPHPTQITRLYAI